MIVDVDVVVVVAAADAAELAAPVDWEELLVLGEASYAGKGFP